MLCQTTSFCALCLAICMTTLCCSPTHATDEVFEMHYPEDDETGAFIDQTKGRYNGIKGTMESLTRLVPYIQDVFPNFNINAKKFKDWTTMNDSQCATDLRNLGQSLDQNWTLPLLDSFGKIPSGLGRGAFVWPGDFDQCQSFKAPITELFPSGFKGQYCMLILVPEQLPKPIQSGICVPSSCSPGELSADYSALKTFLGNVSVIKKYQSFIPNGYVKCYPNEMKLNSSSIACIVMFCVFGALVVAGSAYEFFLNCKPRDTPTTSHLQGETNAAAIFTIEDTEKQFKTTNGVTHKQETDSETIRQKKHWVLEILLCFSAITNVKSIMDTTMKKGQLNCIHGIRFITMTWVILGHTYLFGMPNYNNLVDVAQFLNTWAFRVMASSSFSVDTFFVMSGFLLTYLFIKDRSQFSLKKLGVMYSHRYIRLTPVYMAVIFFFATVFNFIGDGPYWNYAAQESNPCTTNWWKNLLFINNLFPSVDHCLPWSWYLGADMQFFRISPLFLIFLKSSRRQRQYVGLGIVSTLFLISWINTGVVSKKNNLPIHLTDLENGNQEGHTIQYDLIYIKPWTRIGPYLIGCLLGYIFYKVKDNRIAINYKCVIIGWTTATAIALTEIYSLYDAHPSSSESAAYNALARSAWGVSVGWVIFACITGNGGPVNTFLSWRAFFPLSRLTFCAYLVHPMIIFVYYQTQRAPTLMSHVVAATLFCGFTVLAYGLALILSLMFEAPLMKIEKYLRPGNSVS